MSCAGAISDGTTVYMNGNNWVNYPGRMNGRLSTHLSSARVLIRTVRRIERFPHSGLCSPSTSRTILTSIGEGKAVLATTRILRHINAIVASEESPLYHGAGMDITGRPLDTHMNVIQLMLLYRLIEIIPRLSPQNGTNR